MTKRAKARGVIVLEGADCSGKTTLARHLMDQHGARYLHGRVFPNMWKFHVAMVRRVLRLANEHLVVVDRLLLSELIYGQVYRGAPAYDLGARCLDRVLQRVGAVTILCAPRDQEAQLKKHAERAERGEEAYQNVAEVIALYADLARGNLTRHGDGYLGQLIRYGDYALRKDVLTYDWATEGVKRITARALQIAYELRADQLPAALRSDQQNFTGNLTTATTLLVGDRVAPLAHKLSVRGPRWPFCWHDGLSAATWLNRALHLISHDEMTTVTTNAYDADDHLPEILAAERSLRVVALGQNARRRLTQLGHAPDVTLNHPQWERRFRTDGLAEYAEQLRRAIRCDRT